MAENLCISYFLYSLGSELVKWLRVRDHEVFEVKNRLHIDLRIPGSFKEIRSKNSSLYREILWVASQSVIKKHFFFCVSNRGSGSLWQQEDRICLFSSVWGSKAFKPAPVIKFKKKFFRLVALSSSTVLTTMCREWSWKAIFAFTRLSFPGSRDFRFQLSLPGRRAHSIVVILCILGCDYVMGSF